MLQVKYYSDLKEGLEGGGVFEENVDENGQISI